MKILYVLLFGKSCNTLCPEMFTVIGTDIEFVDRDMFIQKLWSPWHRIFKIGLQLRVTGQ